MGGVGQMRSTIADMDPVKRGRFENIPDCVIHDRVPRVMWDHICEDGSYEWNHVRALSIAGTHWYKWVWITTAIAPHRGWIIEEQDPDSSHNELVGVTLSPCQACVVIWVAGEHRH